MRTQTEIEDRDHIMDLRYKATYKGYKNSLVEWTLSDAWTGGDWGYSAIRGTARDMNLNHGPRKIAYSGDILSGEFECK